LASANRLIANKLAALAKRSYANFRLKKAKNHF